MRELDRDGRILCEIQGTIFEKSAEYYGTSSAIFVRRYMHSDYAARMDCCGSLDRPTDAQDAFESLNEEYGQSHYGRIRYSGDELFWMGYLYRCWAYVYDISSKSVYRIISVTELHELYYSYHTMDPLKAIDRIMESKDCILSETDEEKQLAYAVNLLRRIRQRKAVK